MDYQVYFPDWKVLGNDVLYREQGPVLQGILFNRSSREDYCPTAFIRNLACPFPKGVIEQAQRLKHKNGAPDRAIRLVSHKALISEVVNELRRQTEPSIAAPLDALEVLWWYTKRAIPTIPEAYSLSILYAYLGMDNEARNWIHQFRQLQNSGRFLISNFVIEYALFLKDLEEWLELGVAKTRLDIVIQNERRKIGIL